MNCYSCGCPEVAVASTTVHELTHATDKNSNGDINKSKTHENTPKSNQNCFINEIDSKKTSNEK